MNEETVPLAASPPATHGPARLWNRNFVIFWQGQFISRLGDQAFSIALALWITQTIGSATLMGLILAVSNLPSLFLTPIGGAVADRYSRRTILILVDGARGALLLILAGAYFLIPQDVNTLLALLFVAAIGLDIAGAFFGPAAAASIPNLVPRERVAGANSLGQFSTQVALFVGQAFGGTLYRLVGAPLMLLANAGSFLYAMQSTLLIRIPQHTPEQSRGWREAAQRFAADLRDGLRFVWGATGLRELVLISALSNFFTAPILLLLPFYVREHLQAAEDWYGYLLAAFGVGAMLGYAIVSAVVLKGRARAAALIIVMLVDGALYGILGMTRQPLTALGLALINGATGAFVMVHIMSLVQVTAPDHMRGRVMSLLSTIAGSVVPIAMGLGGVVADQTGRNIPLIYGVCSAILVTLTALIAGMPSVRGFLAFEPAPAGPPA